MVVVTMLELIFPSNCCMSIKCLLSLTAFYPFHLNWLYLTTKHACSFAFEQLEGQKLLVYIYSTYKYIAYCVT